MKIITVRVGPVGKSIVKELVQSGRDITTIDRHPPAMKIASVSEAEWQFDDVYEPMSPQRVNLDEADIVVAITDGDEVNLVVLLLAKAKFGVERVIVRVNSLKNERLSDESWGVDVAVPTPRVAVPYVEDTVASECLAMIVCFHSLGAALPQTTLPPKALAVKLAVSGVVFLSSIVLNTIVRDGASFTAELGLTVEVGNRVLLLRSTEAEEDLDIVRESIDDNASLGSIQQAVPFSDGGSTPPASSASAR